MKIMNEHAEEQEMCASNSTSGYSSPDNSEWGLVEDEAKPIKVEENEIGMEIEGQEEHFLPPEDILPFTEKDVESVYRNYQDVDNWKFMEKGDLKGYSNEDHVISCNYVDKKSEKVFNIYKSHCRKMVEFMFDKKQGIIPIKTLKNPRPLAHLVNVKMYEEAKAKAKTALESKFKKSKKKNVPTKLKEAKKPDLKKESSSEFEKSLLKSILKRKSVNRRRLTQAPKRYLEGGESHMTLKPQSTSQKKLPLRKGKEEFVIGLLTPKHPRRVEYSPCNRSYLDSLTIPPSEKMEKRRQQKNKALKGLFEISNLLESGELEEIVLTHQLEIYECCDDVQEEVPLEEGVNICTALKQSRPNFFEKVAYSTTGPDCEVTCRPNVDKKLQVKEYFCKRCRGMMVDVDECDSSAICNACLDFNSPSSDSVFVIKKKHKPTPPQLQVVDKKSGVSSKKLPPPPLMPLFFRTPKTSLRPINHVKLIEKQNQFQPTKSSKCLTKSAVHVARKNSFWTGKGIQHETKMNTILSKIKIPTLTRRTFSGKQTSRPAPQFSSNQKSTRSVPDQKNFPALNFLARLANAVDSQKAIPKRSMEPILWPPHPPKKPFSQKKPCPPLKPVSWQLIKSGKKF